MAQIVPLHSRPTSILLVNIFLNRILCSYYTSRIYFDNKPIEFFINLTSTLHDLAIRSIILSNNNNFDAPTVVYNLEKPIHSTTFNLNIFVSNFDVDGFLHDNTTLPCNCERSEFIDQHHKHIFIDSLNFIKDNKLRNLFTKRPKYVNFEIFKTIMKIFVLKNKTIAFEKAKSDIAAVLNKFIKTWCTIHRYDKNIFNE